MHRETYDLLFMPKAQTERIYPCARVQALHAPNRREWDRKPYTLAVKRREREIWRQEVQLSCLSYSLVSTHKIQKTVKTFTHIGVLFALHT